MLSEFVPDTYARASACICMFACAGLPACSPRGSRALGNFSNEGAHSGMRMLAGYEDGSLRLFGTGGGGTGAEKKGKRRQSRKAQEGQPCMGQAYGDGVEERGGVQGMGDEGAVLLWKSDRHKEKVVAVAAHPNGHLALSASR